MSSTLLHVNQTSRLLGRPREDKNLISVPKVTFTLSLTWTNTKIQQSFHGLSLLHVWSLEQQKRQQGHTTSASLPPRQSARRIAPLKTQREVRSPVKKFRSIERKARFFQSSSNANEGTVPVSWLELSDTLCTSVAVARPGGIGPPMVLKDKSKCCRSVK